MKEYLFYIEGLNREVWFKGSTEREAHAGVWQSLTNYEQDAVVQIECIDEREAKDRQQQDVFGSDRQYEIPS